jgi:hypothetical protein
MRYKTDILMSDSKYRLKSSPEKNNTWSGLTYEDDEGYALLESTKEKIALPYNLSARFGRSDELITTMMFPRDVHGLRLTRLGSKTIDFTRKINGFELTSHDDETTVIFGRGSFSGCQLIDDSEVEAVDGLDQYLLNRIIKLTVSPLIQRHVERTRVEFREGQLVN